MMSKKFSLRASYEILPLENFGKSQMSPTKILTESILCHISISNDFTLSSSSQGLYLGPIEVSTSTGSINGSQRANRLL